MWDRIKRRIDAAHYQRRRQGAFQSAFDMGASQRLLLLSVDHRIPQSQLFPFHYYADTFRARHDLDIREVVLEEYGRAEHPKDATIVCFQTQFDVSLDALNAHLETIKRLNPGARIVYLDWFAPTDLRLAEMVGPLVDAYLTKHLLRDRALYGQPTFGTRP